MTKEKGLRSTSPIHVHVEDTPVHVHVKKGKKKVMPGNLMYYGNILFTTIMALFHYTFLAMPLVELSELY